MKTRKSKPTSPSSTAHQPFFPNMARKSSICKLFLTLFFLLAIYSFFLAIYSFFLAPLVAPSPPSSEEDLDFDFTKALGFAGGQLENKVKIFTYDLPHRFTYGIIEQHRLARGGSAVPDVTALKYPGHQHMHEWYLYSDLARPESERVGSPVIRVSSPEEADLFFVPVFSSLSLIVNAGKPPGSGTGYSDEQMQEELVEWLQGQEYWKRNGGWDHVIIAGDPNALYRIVDRVKNAVLLVSDFGRLRPDQGSLVKDVIIPYSHRIRTYSGDFGVDDRKTLLFFMGNRYRKEGGKIRDLLFQILENEQDVIIKHGTQSTENRRAASQGMHTSKFCLNPAGDTPSACRLFDAIVSLCVPVIVSDSIELPFEDKIDYRKFSVFVQTEAALRPGYLVSLLREVPAETIVEYQKAMREVKRYYDYTDQDGAVNEIWRQVSQKLPLVKLMSNRDRRLVKRASVEPNCSCMCSNQTGIISSL